MALFGFRNSARLDLPTGLEELSNRTALTWDKSPRQIATELTLFPYFVRYFSEKRADLVLAMMSGRNNVRGRHLHTCLGLSSSAITSPAKLLFCRACADRDRARFGETYWRRAHQLPGALVCHEHGCLLFQSSAPAVPRKNWMYFDASTYTVLGGPSPVASLSLEGTKTAQALAKRSREILAGLRPSMQQDRLTAHYRSSMIERGFVDQSNKFSASRAENALRTFYGDKLLTLLGCSVAPRRSGWLRTMLQPSKTAPRHPLRHVLIQVFLESCPLLQRSRVLYGAGIWKCPNSFGKHTAQFPIRAYKSKRRQNMAPVISAQCACGMRFAFSDVDPDDSLVPRISSVRQLAPSWERQIIHQRSSGFTVKSIAEKNGLPFNCVRKALAKSKLFASEEEHLFQLRSNWSALLSQIPGANRSLAREANPRLYAELKMLDPVWLHKTGTRKSKPRRLTERDWADRDRKWAAHLSGAIDRLKVEQPSGHFSATSIIKNAGLKLWILSRPHQLPRCQEVLSR